MEVFYRFKKMLEYDFQSIIPGGRYPFTRETALHLLLYMGFMLFALQMFFYPDLITCRLQNSSDQNKFSLPQDSTEI